MKKLFFPIITLSIILLMGAGCSKNENNVDSEQVQVKENSSSPQGFQMNDNFIEARIDDLNTGETIMVMGEVSEVGVVADRIIIGQGDFGFLGTNRPTSTDINTEQPQQDRPAFRAGEDFQNMTPEQREEFRSRMDTEGGFRGRNGTFQGGEGNTGVQIRRPPTQASLRGEILELDETSITIKLTDGGSKLIFYSSETSVLKFKDSTNEDIGNEE